MGEANNKERNEWCVQNLTLSLQKQRAGRSEGEAEGTSKALSEGRVVGDKVRGKKERYRLSKAIVRSLD